MTLDSTLLFIAAAFLASISPGPAVLLAISNSVRFGPGATVWSSLGNALGLFILGLTFSYGLGALIATSELTSIAIKLAGAIYLVVLGIRLWSTSRLTQTAKIGRITKTHAQLFNEALLVSLTNPKAMVILVALLPPFIDSTRPLFIQVVILSAIYASLCLPNHLCIAYFASRAKLALVPVCGRLSQRIAGSAFIGLGVTLVLR